MIMFSFSIGQCVKHLKSGGRYVVIEIPNKFRRLEHSNEMHYAYCLLGDAHTTDKTVWLRCKSEMEDGRFIPISHTVKE